MELFVLGLAVVLLLILVAEFINGWTDAPNAIATVVSTGVLEPRFAVPMAAVLNLLGTLAGTAVAKTIGQGIVAEQFVTLPALAAAMLSVIVWGGFAANRGIPVSKSHALMSGLAGAGIAGGGLQALLVSGWIKVGYGLIFSLLLGFAGAFVIGRIIILLFSRASPGRAGRIFGGLQVISAAAMAFTHGMNDGQKFVGVFTLALVLGRVTDAFVIDWRVMLLCALVMGLGTSLGGWRIIATIGKKMVEIVPWQGFTAETAGSLTIFVASHFGIPLSTTHTITSSIAGATSSLRPRDVQWGVAFGIVRAWIYTFPICGFLAFCAALLANYLF
jgi:PiT family inorganic phosphate transporter